MSEKFIPEDARGLRPGRGEIRRSGEARPRPARTEHSVRVPEKKEAETSPELVALRSAADQLIARAEDHLRAKFEERGGNEDLNYHRTQHTADVRRNAREILQAMKDGGADVSERDMIVVEVAAAAHDLVQEWRERDARFQPITPERFASDEETAAKAAEQRKGPVMRQRFAKFNERASVAMMLEWIQEQETENEEKTFRTEDLKKIMEAVKATVPDFDPKFATVQNLVKLRREKDASTGQMAVAERVKPTEASPIVRAVAMADLSSAGRNPDRFLAEGDELFVEENIDMRDIDPSTLTEKQRNDYKARIVGWSKSQANFARGRKVMFELEIGGLPTEAKKNLRKMFSFETSIRRAERQGAARDKMSFDDLYATVGFVEPRPNATENQRVA